MILIQDYIVNKLKSGVSILDIAYIFDTSIAMVYKYKNKKLYPTLKIAIRVFIEDRTILIPYSKEGIQKAIKDS